ncbi:MAG TPA: ABC transporter ATP-binding protein [Chitinophagaceae bacterium]|nr:ABC transporter ATP-binding protein [Chitinophagaceae bacterium]
MNSFIVETKNLNFSFRSAANILGNVNLQVQQGSIYGFLGPNGAGKTTTLRLLLGLLTMQEGSIEIFGKDIRTDRIEILKNVGSLIEQPSLYGHLTAKENLEVYRKIFRTDKNRIMQVLELVGLENTNNKKAKQFSLGMKQRLSIAIALLHQPKLLILDEPTNGLDPNGIIETRELIKKLNKEHGVSIIVSSHILAEVERMATHVGIIHKGKLLFQGTLPELQHLKNKQSFLQVDTTNNDEALKLLQQQFGAERKNGFLVLPVNTKEEAATINRTLIQNGIDVHLLQPQQNDLEQLFIDITSGN